MQTAAVYDYPDEARLALSILEANGIEGLIPDEYVITWNWFYQTALGGIRVQVPDNQVATAREVLRDVVDTRLAPQCPRCGAATLRQMRLQKGDVAAIACGFLLPGAEARYHCAQCRTTFPVRRAVHDPETTEALTQEALRAPYRDSPPRQLPLYFNFALGCAVGAVLVTALLPLRMIASNTALSAADNYAFVTLGGGLAFYLIGLADQMRHRHLRPPSKPSNDPI